MEINYRIVDTTESFEAFRALLKTSNLPHDDLNYKRDLLIGCYDGDNLVGTGGLEVHGNYALLRSLAVKMEMRGNAVGLAITELLLSEARKRHLRGIYLLTETARTFFLKRGFTEVTRDQVPKEVKVASEFSTVCPVSATVMYLPLN